MNFMKYKFKSEVPSGAGYTYIYVDPEYIFNLLFFITITFKVLKVVKEHEIKIRP